ncbi:MAG: hypothetical protein WBV31_11560 [Terriglobales bacterium]
MLSNRQHVKGFTLIATLLMLLLLSGIAIGLLMMVTTEGKVGGTDLQNNMAYHAAEGGIENMAANLAGALQNAQATTPAEICNVGMPNTNGPTLPGVTWLQYSAIPQGLSCPPANNATLTYTWGQITSGPNQGLWAQTIPINMLATAAMPGGQEVSMSRSAQIALIPVFQYGAFSEGDLAFFSTPSLDFNGRVHTNGDLYLGVAAGNTLTFHHKLEAYGNVVENYLPNGVTVANGNDLGTVYIPTTEGGCTTTTTSCVAKNINGDSTYGQGSVQGKGGNPPQSTYVPASGTDTWTPFSESTTNSEIINGNYGNTAAHQSGTGARKLSLPFVGGNTLPYEIIRRPPAGENTTTALSASREYNMAQIRVLLDDDPANLPGGASDTNNVRLANVTQTTGNTVATTWGVPIPAPNYSTATFPTPSGGNTYNLYFASASNAVPIPSSCPTAAGNPPVCSTPDWPYAPLSTFAAWTASQGLQPAGAPILWSYGITPPTPSNPPTLSICPPASPAPLSVPVGCQNGVYPYYPLPIADTPVASGALTNYPHLAASNAWSLIDGYLRVEYHNSSGQWVPVTNEWLQLGFARGVTPPTANRAGLPATGTKNPINPNAILLLQEPADRSTGPTLMAEPTVSGGVWAVSQAGAPTCSTTSGSGAGQRCTSWTAGTPAVPLLAADSGVSGGQWVFGVTPASPTATTPQSLTQFNWYPINFYDAREGEVRDVDQGNNSCTSNGVMNAVEIDVGNLQQWLKANIGSSGTSVEYTTQNGYVLYFSDRRGMLLNPHATTTHLANTKSGDSGLEDVVNASSQAGTPDGVLEPAAAGAPLSPAGVALSPEDVNENGVLDNWGTADLGLGQWNGTTNQNTQIVLSNPDNPYLPRIASCSTTGRKNWVSGARHVLKLVDGSLGNLPITPVGTSETIAGVTKTYYGGFTVAAENPVYIQGDYNSVTAGGVTTDTFFTNQQNTAPAKDLAGYVPAAVIADAVTVLSNSWDDRVSMVGTATTTDITYAANPYAGDRIASTTSYRVAIAGGKNMSFPMPSWDTNSADYPFATDGGVGNFLRFLEQWSGQTLNYGGSLVSMYYSTYNTGLFKCCTYIVYSPPVRNYVFDVDFTLPGGVGLPPGTPLFRDVETLGYRQLFSTRTTGQ